MKIHLKDFQRLISSDITVEDTEEASDISLI